MAQRIWLSLIEKRENQRFGLWYSGYSWIVQYSLGWIWYIPMVHFQLPCWLAALKMFTRNARFQLIIWPAKNLPNTFWNLCFWDTHTEVRTHIHTRTWRAIVLLCSIPWNECANKEMGGELRNPRSNTSRIRQWQVNELNASTSSPRASSKTSQICHLSFTMMHRSHPFTTLATNSWYLTTHKFLSQHHDCLKIVLNSSWL